MNKYLYLLSPVQIGNHIVKNRLVYPNASPHTLQGPETFPAEGYRAFFSGVARNGAAIVTVSEWNNPNQRKGPADSDFTHMQSFDLGDPSTHNYFSQLADEVHFYGSKLILDVMVDMPAGYSLHGGPAFGPGAGPGAKDNKPLPKEMMPEVIEAFVKKLRLYKNFGYDGFTVRCDMHLLPNTGQRDDEYTGDVVNRSRFIREVYAAVKKAFGGDFIAEAIVAWEQPHGYGANTGVGCSAEEVLQFCKLIDGFADIIQIREHDVCRSHPTGFNFTPGDHPAVDFAARLKAAGVKALLEPIGGFQEPCEMDKYIADGKCDMYGMARGFMADYDWGEKVYEGRAEDIVPCLKCNKCHGAIHPEPDPWLSVCSVNPIHGISHKLSRMVGDVVKPKDVAVIGGGCAGMRAAIIAAQRGHKVTLYEKTGVLGGQLLHADFFAFKWPIKNYKEWLIRQLGKSGVGVVMNCAPGRDAIAGAGFDAVLAATGAVPNLPDSIEGLRDSAGKALYPTIVDVFGRQAELGKRVVIVGGSESGIETAMYLMDNGHEVTVLTRQCELARDASKLHYITMAWLLEQPDGSWANSPAWEAYDKLTGIVNVTTKSVLDNVVTYADQDGGLHTIKGDSVVVCGGMTPCRGEAMKYADTAPRFFPIGDCNGAGNIQRCTRDAFARASIL